MASGPIKSRQILTDLDLRNNTIYDANIPYKQHYYEYETSLDNISGAKEGDIAKIEETDKTTYYKYHNGAWVLIQDPDTELSETSTNTVQNQAVTKVILDNEKVVAAMGNDLNDRILNIDNEISTINTNVETITPLVEITYADLKTLRDTNKLVPGKQYRITDYQCTTTQKNTKSAGHQFDIIVTADSTNKLNEVARACLHSGDTYFSSCNLNAWKIQYCLDNDTTKFVWVDATNGKGVIYRMIDEFSNDIPYDFKNIQFIPYSKDNSITYYVYTFNIYGLDNTDSSLNGNSYNNKIGILKDNVSLILNNICFIGYNCYNNTFENQCSNNTFGEQCYNNTFGDYCGNNTFGDYCKNNTFGDYCENNTFENQCSNNTFGEQCYNNTFGAYCENNTFGAYCENNTFGDNFEKNLSETGCGDNKFQLNYINYSIFNCYNVTLSTNGTLSDETPITNLLIKYGVTGNISVPVGQAYQWIVAKDSNGNIVQYCEDDITVGKGTTAERPTGKTVGYQYFDTTLNKPIWYTGTVWVDSTGAKPNNVIFYTSTDGNIVTPNDTTAFIGTDGTTQLNIISNTYSNGKGTIIFDGYIGIIGNAVFSSCNTLQSIVIPNSVTSILQEGFSGCSGLTDVSIPESVTSIGNFAFADCSGLTSVVIPTSVTSIGNSAFSGCSGLTSVSIPGSVTGIGNSAFEGCSGLTSVSIPSSVTSIGNSAFIGCSGLTSVIIPNSVTSIGDWGFYGCSGLTSVSIPGSVTGIGNSAFEGCSALTSIVIPEGVTSIGESAFSSCSGLTSVSIPESVTSIGPWVFGGSSNITILTISMTTLPLFTSCGFNSSTKYEHIYVPSNLVDTYKAADGWKTYATIIEAIPA